MEKYASLNNVASKKLSSVGPSFPVQSVGTEAESAPWKICILLSCVAGDISPLLFLNKILSKSVSSFCLWLSASQQSFTPYLRCLQYSIIYEKVLLGLKYNATSDFVSHSTNFVLRA